MSAGVKENIKRKVLMGVGPRSACFAPLCGYDFQALATSGVDILMPKHYFFARGFDGLVGTVGRWVETLTEWNSLLSDSDALEIVKAVFGIELSAHVSTRLDLESVLDKPEFYATVVYKESLRALAAVDNDATRVVPWLDTGRLPHNGDAMTAGSLRLLMEAAHRAGLRCMVGSTLFCHNPHVAEIIDSHIVLKMSCGAIMLSELSPPRQFVGGGVDYH